MNNINMDKIVAGDKVRVVAVPGEFVKFVDMSVGDEFIVDRVKNGHSVHLTSDDNSTRLSFSVELFNKYFEKVEEDDEDFYDVDDEEFDYIADMLSASEFNVTTVFDKCTIVACQLPNGFVIVESSSCVDPDDYDEEIGIENCLNRIKDKVIEMEAYVAHEEIAHMREDGNDSCDGDCENCDHAYICDEEDEGCDCDCENCEFVEECMDEAWYGDVDDDESDCEHCEHRHTCIDRK